MKDECRDHMEDYEDLIEDMYIDYMWLEVCYSFAIFNIVFLVVEIVLGYMYHPSNVEDLDHWGTYIWNEEYYGDCCETRFCI